MLRMWMVLFLALTGSHFGYGLPVRPTPQDYPLDGSSTYPAWGAEGGVYAAIPVLALVVTGIVLLFGCTWCYRHKDCKPNEGTDNQLFTASAQHLQAAARVVPPDSGFSEPVNNNISEDNNNGPISLREMQNIANNNAAAYIVSENEERNRISRESVVEFEPLPIGIIGADPLERCADWFGIEDFPRDSLQYLREIDRGWFGRVVEGEIEEAGSSSTVAVKILNQNATLEDKARFLDEAMLYRDVTHENILAFIGKCLHEDPWILLFELCPMDLQQYLIVNRPKMATLNENGVPLRLMCDISSALTYLHSRGYVYGGLWSGSVLLRSPETDPRAVLGRYSHAEPDHEYLAPEVRQGAVYTTSSEIWSLGSLIWEVCSWGAAPTARPSPPPELPCPYKSHLYQVMQLCWSPEAGERPSAAQVFALVSHLQSTHAAERAQPQDAAHFEARWQRLKPNSIPRHDEHVAIVHACEPPSRASSAMSARSLGSLTNLHGSLDDVRDIYLTHNEAAPRDCHQANTLHDQDRSDASLDPWIKEIVAARDDVSYYRDVSDVIKNLDNILNSEKTSSSESSHQASPSRDNLSLDCKREYAAPSGLVKSPGITDFQHVIDTGFAAGVERGSPGLEDEVDRDTIGTLSHSFERRSDSASQHTLENLTPDTPARDVEVFVDIERLATDAEISEIESQTKSADIEREPETFPDATETETAESEDRDEELPKVVDSDAHEKILRAASTPSVSDHERSPSKDCQTPCDNVAETRTDDETKSIDDVREAAGGMPLDFIEVTDFAENVEREEGSAHGVSAPVSADESTINEGVDTLPSVTEDESAHEHDTSLVRFEDAGPPSVDSEHDYSKDETVLVSDLADTLTDTSKDEHVKLHVQVDLEPVPIHAPVSVQNIKDAPSHEPDLKQIKKAESAIVKLLEITPTHMPPEIVQNTDSHAAVPETENLVCKEAVEIIENLDSKNSEASDAPRSDSLEDIQEREGSPKDLIINTNSQIYADSTVDNSNKLVPVAASSVPRDDTALSKNDSTQYLDLPSFDMIKKTSDFLQMEKTIAANSVQCKLVSSTPLGSDKSGEMLDSFGHGCEDETMITSKTKIPLYESATSDQKCLENMSPFESPSHRSHQTDTYDENSSVVLGPFENCNADIKGSKPNIDPVELPREELLAFSSNFSEMNLETPSPLRDGNFLNEVPDIAPDVISGFDDLTSITEPKEGPSEDTESGTGTQKRVSPLTPPNSPGVSLAGTSQEKYLVDIDLNVAPEPESPIRSIDLNQIELQITSKLAMAENENNLNIEYSGPLTVEGLIEEGGAMRESDAMPELYLAGNGGSVEDVRELLSLNEECVQALRNELELKLPLAQVAGIEPAAEAEAGEWNELPPPPELVVSYLGALSPIQEETAPQLSAYENDAHWNPSIRTESSESYPEPCNNSTDSATSLPRGDTYTVQRLVPPDQHEPATSSREITMSVDSLNDSAHESGPEGSVTSPIDDRTYKVDERTHTIEERCERISQVSPFLVSPTADTDDTRLSTLSRTTDAKHSRPEDTQLSKATSIDSWCSNDTLYNVEENFDELAPEPEPEERPHSVSSDTLTLDEPSSAHTPIEPASERADTFSSDSIAERRTYTKPAAVATPSDTTQTRDLAYGTLGTYTSCSAEALEEAWRPRPPELMRREPTGDCNLTPPQHNDDKECDDNLTPLLEERRLSRLESIEITCLRDPTVDSPARHDNNELISQTITENGQGGPTQTSTPLVDSVVDPGHVEGFAMNLAEICAENSGISNGETLHESNEVTTQDSTNVTSPEEFLEAKSRTPNLDKASLLNSETSLNYLEFENSASSKPQSKIEWEHTPTFADFEKSAALKPQNKATLESDPVVSELKNYVAVETSASEIVESNDGNAANSPANIPEVHVDTVPSPAVSNIPGKSQDKVEPERSPTYSEFENSAAFKPQEKTTVLEITPTYSDFENSAVCKPQDKSKERPDSTTYSEFENSAMAKPQDRTIIEKSTTYSDFENSATFKPQENKLITERSTTYTDFENSANFKPQENKTVVEHSTTYSEFENSADFKPQENKTLIERSTTYSDFENSANFKPQDNVISERSPTGSQQEEIVESQSQNKVSTDKSSQSMESGISSEEFRSFENSVKGRPQDLSSLIDASSQLLNSERMFSDSHTSQPHDVHTSQPLDVHTSQPFDVNTSQPHDVHTSQPLDVHTSQPLDVHTSQPFDVNTSQPHDVHTSQSLDVHTSQPLDVHTSQPFDVNTSQPHDVHTSQPLDVNTSQPHDVHTSQPLDVHTSQPLDVNTSQPHDVHTSQPLDVHTSQPLDVHTSQLHDVDTSQPHDVHTSQPLDVHTSPSNGDVTPPQPVVISPPSITNLVESHELLDARQPTGSFLINFDLEDETEQPHSIIVTEMPMAPTRISPNRTYDSHAEALVDTFNSHANRSRNADENLLDLDVPKMNGSPDQPKSLLMSQPNSSPVENPPMTNHAFSVPDSGRSQSNDIVESSESRITSNGPTDAVQNVSTEVHMNGGSEKFATVNFLNETFEELVESSVDDSDSKDDRLIIDESAVPETPSDQEEQVASPIDNKQNSPSRSVPSTTESEQSHSKSNGVPETEGKITTLTEDFLQNEKKYATLDSYFPLLSDIRFTGPASEMMSTSFQDSPTSPHSPECEQDSKPSAAADNLKEWDSDSESHSSNSSSGEFIWKDGDGHETSVVPTTHFDHQRGPSGGEGGNSGPAGDGRGSGASSGSGDSGSGSEGDEVEFVPSSWDCRAAPAKSSLRSLEQATPESKKRVVFKRQKYHCVYEYPREAADVAHSPACLPDLSTYCEWDPSSAEEAELCYGQLFSSTAPLPAGYPLRAGGGGGGPFGSDYDEDFFISSSARPFESLGIMSTTSQFFPGGLGAKRALLERSLSDEGFPAPAPPELGFTTPDSGVEDLTPGATLELELGDKPEDTWRPLDSASSSESVSPTSPGELGGLRHTRDRLKLDLPPSPAAASPRHARVFSFPRRRGDTPLVMSDDTPAAPEPLPAAEARASPPPEPTFSTFGKRAPRPEPEQRLILTDEPEPEAERAPDTTAPDSADEDSGIESSAKATLDTNTNT